MATKPPGGGSSRAAAAGCSPSSASRRVIVTRRDVEVFGVDPEALCKALRQPLRISGKVEAVADLHGVYRAGSYVPDPSAKHPVYLVVRCGKPEYAGAVGGKGPAWTCGDDEEELGATAPNLMFCNTLGMSAPVWPASRTPQTSIDRNNRLS